jgi:hypothetical protein
MQEAVPNSYADLDDVRQAITALQAIIDDLPQAYKKLGDALELQYRNNAPDSTQDVTDLEQTLRSARTALAVAATKAAEIAAEHQVMLHALAFVVGPPCASGPARPSKA